jgi:hypothetical protein
MTSEIVDTEQGYRDQVVEGERGALVAVLVMVVLGVAAIFVTSG